MGGCTNCSSKSGCDDRKGGMFTAIDAALASLYPDRVWGRPNDAARFGAGISPEESQRLAEELAVSLKASTFFRRGHDDEYCDYIYILCMGREPCLVQLRDGGLPVPDELLSEGAAGTAGEQTVSELYLRICLSTLCRFVGVQQVAMTGEISTSTGELFVVEAPRAGVYDAPLLPRFQQLVAELVDRNLEHIDFGDISAPPEGYDSADYRSRYGVTAPAVANYLFFPQPATTEVSEWVELSRAGL